MNRRCCSGIAMAVLDWLVAGNEPLVALEPGHQCGATSPAFGRQRGYVRRGRRLTHVAQCLDPVRDVVGFVVGLFLGSRVRVAKLTLT